MTKTLSNTKKLISADRLASRVRTVIDGLKHDARDFDARFPLQRASALEDALNDYLNA